MPELNYILMLYFSFACLDLHFRIIFCFLAYQLSLVNLNCINDSCGISLIFNKRRFYSSFNTLFIKNR